MKKILLSCLLTLSLLQARADEGMWTLYNLPQAIFEQMKAEGFKLPYDDLYKSDNAIKNAVVNFSGYCSGVVVSPDGLVFTNHHCGFDAIRRHSTVEHDYMRNGFFAKELSDELPNERVFVSFMVDQKDITPRLEEDGFFSLSRTEQSDYLTKLENEMLKDVKAQDSTLRLEIKPFYERNKYYATTYRDFNDVRLVFTVPKSMGKFGGDTDNWMWPRQTCDFSVFRIYADPKTNGPAKYSKDNVPYRPKTWAKVSMDGYTEGDYAMTIGYPGTTKRYLSSYGIREMRDANNTPMAQVRGVKQAIMRRHMLADDAVRIKYDSKYATSSNYWKNAIGMNKCIDSIGVIQQKRDYEAAIRKWQDETGYLKGQLDFNKMQKYYDKRFEVTRAMTYLRETFNKTSEFSDRAYLLTNGAKVYGNLKKPNSQYHLFADNSSEWDEALDKEVFAALLKNLRGQVDKKFLPTIYNTIDKEFDGDYTKYVDYLYANSFVMKSGKKIYFNKKSFCKDPGVEFALSLSDVMASLNAQLKEVADSIADQEKLLCAAKLRMEEDMPHYSDANFTMRLSYGQVKPLAVGNSESTFYTEASSMLDKMKRGNENIDYFAEPIMHELLGATDFEPYTDKKTGKMHLCFLTTNDITGGNSGSAIFGGDGRLLGLAFDGNWDSLSNSINFDSRLARCIGVDIRYMLYMMDKWGHADRLLKELGVK